MKVQIKLPPKLLYVFSGDARYRGAFGGRGSGKTVSFAKMTAIRGYQYGMSGKSGVILCGREFMNSLEDSSLEEVKAAIQSEPWLSAYYEVGEKYIKSRDGRISYAFSGLRHNLDSIKSKARILIAWIDEAETVSETAWMKLLPTVRADDSEVWITWNPEIQGSPTDDRFRQHMPENARIVEMNYPDNPWFPDVLEQERLNDLARLSPEDYAWVWEGQYRLHSDAQIFKGKYDVENFEPKADWDGPYFGLDFGFSQDPTAAVKCWISDGMLYIEQEAGGVGVELDKTAETVKEKMPDIERYVIRADSARPESISYLRRHGLPRIIAVEKGKGSVEDGIEFIKSFKRVIIHERCKALRDEFRLYSYKTDRQSGDILPVIVDKHNHYIDALRYALEPMIKNRGKVKRAELRL